VLEIIRAVNIKNPAFWDVTLWSLEKFTDPLGCMPPLSSELVLETNRTFRNVRIFSQDSTTTPQDTVLKNIDSLVY
jgi:hypothetical protein